VENRRGGRSAPTTVNSSVRTREYLTTAEIERLMAAARKSSRYGHRDATMILIGYRHGLRATSGKAMFQMMGVFAEFERAMIQERVRAGLARAVSEGKRLGRPPIAPELQKRIVAARASGLSVRKTAARFGIDPSPVQRMARPFEANAGGAVGPA
jgi:Resolvase, N terminal domain